MHARLATLALLVVAVGAVGCVPNGELASLSPTLEMTDVDGVPVAMQNGTPVPSFDWQPRPRIDLDGQWRLQRANLDAELTLTDRSTALEAIEAEANGRHTADFDDSTWGAARVPGTFNPPPDGEEGGAWYRRTLEVPSSWAGRAVTLRFASANYVADVWLNGTWLGYHEGGSTPFAFDVGSALRVGSDNVLAVRVHTIPLGTRTDIVPWGLVDWWNYGGLTGPVWLEAAPPVHVERADVVPHLDAVDVEILLHQAPQLAGTRGPATATDRSRSPLSITASVLPATVSDQNVLDPDPRSLIPADATPLVTAELDADAPLPGEAAPTVLTIGFGDASLWAPESPALYVLRVDLRWPDQPRDAREGRASDTFWTTFGIRHVAVAPDRPAVLLNAEESFLRGVGLHDESLAFGPEGRLLDGTPVQAPSEVLVELSDAAEVGANFLRTGHQPADPTVLMLADRLGFAVWEEIPLYHASPFIFDRVMRRGLPQQMLREMALRDMNRPSVLFHGFANESTGEEERTAALAELHEVDRSIDGTRLTGQAAYGWNPTDPTHAPLDVAGFTSYHGVFYGDDPAGDTRDALHDAHDVHPDKPIMVLEFGRWADTPADAVQQRRIFDETYPVLEQLRSDRAGGFVSAATWWTLHDFATQISGIVVEDFGLYRPDGTLRPAGERASEAFETGAGEGSELALEPELERPRADAPDGLGSWTLALYLGYGLSVVVGVLGVLLAILTRRGGRAVGRAR